MLMNIYPAHIEMVYINRETILVSITIMDDYVGIKIVIDSSKCQLVTEGVLFALTASNAIDRFRFEKGNGYNIIKHLYKLYRYY